MAVLTAPEGVLNTYSTLDELKARTGITGTSGDVTLWHALHSASRGVDGWCGRHFFSLLAARIFDVDDPEGFAVPDLISVSSLQEDADRDRVFELMWLPADYFLLPNNASPLSEWGRPYTRIAANPDGTTPQFTVGRSAVRVDGEWGYRSLYGATGATVAGGGVTALATTLIVSNGALFAPGQTLLVESEQVFVQQVAGNDLTVVRGANGTLAAAHSAGELVSRVRYPAEVVEAALLVAARIWKRKDSAYGYVAGVAGLGGVRVAPSFDSDIAELLSPFRKLRVGAIS